MEGYFSIKIKFVLTVLLAVLFYVSYLYVFKEQRSTTFTLNADCTEAQIKEGSAKGNLFFEDYFEERVLRKPEWQSALGRKEQNDKWNSLTEAAAQMEYTYDKEMLDYLEDSILLSVCLDAPTMRNANLLKNKLKIALEAYAYRYYNYPVNSINGEQLKIISVLIEEHRIDDFRDAEEYISRVQKVEKQIDELMAALELRSQKNIFLPKHLFSEVLTSVQKIVENREGKPNVLLNNFDKKIESLNLETEEKETLKERLGQAYNQVLVPSYQKLYNYLVDLEQKATDEIGAWRWNEDYYAFKLKEQTHTSLTPDEVYNLGLEEVSRIHGEMNKLLKQLNYKGDLQDFFNFLQTNPQFFYPNTNMGKQACMNRIEANLDSITTRLGDYFVTKGKTDVAIKPLRNTDQRSPLENKEPNIYYVNLEEISALPKYMTEAMTYYNAIPGHHFQMSIEASLMELPVFRRLNYSAVYTKGWGMYATYLAKEMGAYQDVYADFGRLSLDLWRTCHLVVDVGIHHKKWTKEEAIDYYKKNTANRTVECLEMIDRQIVFPAQSVAYKIGMITILELRKQAALELGSKFDLREFHEVLLTNGNVPLDVLQDLVEEYIQLKMK